MAPSEFQEILNNTRLLPFIYNHTDQIREIFARLQKMNVELEAVRDKLENCSMNSGGSTVKPIPGERERNKTKNNQHTIIQYNSLFRHVAPRSLKSNSFKMRTC